MSALNADYGDLCLRLCITMFHSLWLFAGLVVVVIVMNRLWAARSARHSYHLHVLALVIGTCVIPVLFLNVQVPARRVAARVDESS